MVKNTRYHVRQRGKRGKVRSSRFLLVPCVYAYAHVHMPELPQTMTRTDVRTDSDHQEKQGPRVE